MNELYSRPLSPEAREKLIDWTEAYIVSLKSSYADRKAEVAKQKAIELFQTDIDILVFVTTIVVMHSESGRVLLTAAVQGLCQPRESAETLVEIMREGFRRDKGARGG